ncbi:MAG: sigma-54-dependent Fis family transcriptional regulator [Gammaproteobacteria bacterium]|nr:sigma-54-dependent Fis family transcriptional regulator [Gammaproteobacteria bacterium]
MQTTVLIVEDDCALREALCETAAIGGYNALAADNGAAALAVLRDHPVDIVVSDIQMTPMNGHELLKAMRREHAAVPVLLMTAYGSIPDAVSAMQDGASDYLVKPFESEVLISKIAQYVPTDDAVDEDMVVADPRTREIVELARRVAKSDAAVMITGPSGAGKEVFFRFIHRNSRRAEKAPVAINCAAIPENMLEAVLFGYEKGAYTGAYKSCPGKFEQADGSTLLLDEISEMSLPLQAKLLRVLQERQVERLGGSTPIDLDVRIVATSNRDLVTEVAAGRFREDLYYRLNVFPLAVPALRDRPDDVVPLSRFLISRAARNSGVAVPEFTPAAQNRLTAHAWPGNVRELDNVMQRALIMSQNGVIEEADLIFEQAAPTRSSTGLSEAHASIAAGDEQGISLGGSLKDRERGLIIDALREGHGSRKYAAEKLGISARTLRYKLARMRDEGMAVPSR